MKVLSIIPARGGSKRLPRKNIKMLAGKPLIAYSIEQALASKHINRVIVSTEDPEIALVAKDYGAEIPFIRPAELAEDDTPDLPVIRHVLEKLRDDEGYVPDIVVQLRPTSPLRRVDDVDRAIELMIGHPEADSVRTVIEPLSSPYKMYKIAPNGFLEPLLKVASGKEGYNLPDQILPKVYRHIGTADVFWERTVTKKNSLSGDLILPLVIEDAHSGINTSKDWEFYEFLMRQRP